MLDRQKEVKSVSFLDILTKKVYLQPLLITMGVMITQQVKTRVIPCLIQYLLKGPFIRDICSKGGRG